jgi:tetratricopeptide (TPR) repeat protein
VRGDTYGAHLATVHFPVSCDEAARRHAERGLALLHHMTYEGASTAFADATETDPDCAMGYWGQAMTFIHPLWSDPPSEAEFERGQELVKKARTRGEKDEWEEAYIEAVEAYYAPDWSRNEQANLAGFEEGWRKVHDQFPEDPEAASFFALAHMATADPADKSYAKQKRAAEIAQQVRTRMPEHPGAHHYIIHAYDYPPLAEEALAVARSYSDIAPEVPHALHMASHIFTRLGLWEESIAMNRRSAAAALEHAAGGKVAMHCTHSTTWPTPTSSAPTMRTQERSWLRFSLWKDLSRPTLEPPTRLPLCPRV